MNSTYQLGTNNPRLIFISILMNLVPFCQPIFAEPILRCSNSSTAQGSSCFSRTRGERCSLDDHFEYQTYMSHTSMCFFRMSLGGNSAYLLRSFRMFLGMFFWLVAQEVTVKLPLLQSLSLPSRYSTELTLPASRWAW